MLQVATEVVRLHTIGPWQPVHGRDQTTEVWALLTRPITVLRDQETSGKRQDIRYLKMLNSNLRMMGNQTLQEAALLKGTLTKRKAQ